MCLEDITIQRELVTNSFMVSPSVGGQVILAPNKMRIAFAVSQPEGGIAKIGTTESIAANVGFRIISTGQLIVFHISNYGQFVTGEVSALHSAGGIGVLVVETLLKYPLTKGDLNA